MSEIEVQEIDATEQPSEDSATQRPSSSQSESHATNEQQRDSPEGQLQKNENQGKVSVVKRKSFDCQTEGCGKTFPSRLKLFQHILVHGGRSRYKCTTCNTHFKCHLCDFWFHRRYHWERHMELHAPDEKKGN